MLLCWRPTFGAFEALRIATSSSNHNRSISKCKFCLLARSLARSLDHFEAPWLVVRLGVTFVLRTLYLISLDDRENDLPC